MKYNFLECDKGNKSSKRLKAVATAAAAIFLALISGIAAIFIIIAKPKFLLVVIGILFGASFIYSGLTTIEKIAELIKAIKK